VTVVAKVQAFDTQGKDAGMVDLPETVFGMTPHTAVMYEVLLAQLAAKRTGTHSTKTRGDVRGSTRKIYRQKGTGRARHGSRKAPIFRGGGITFGPKPRDYAQDTPRKVRRLAVRSALSAKAKDGRVIVVEPLELEAPRARVIVELLDHLPVAGRTLLVTPAADDLVLRSAANVRGVTVRAARAVSLRDVLDADYLVLTRPAVAVVAEVFGR
jgi:large subunit ribosomal protein L4